MQETREWRDSLTSAPLYTLLPPPSERDGGKGGGESGAGQVGDGERERVRGRWTLGSSLPPLPPSGSWRDLSVSGGRGRGGGGVAVSHARATLSTFLAAGSQKVGAEGTKGGGGQGGGGVRKSRLSSCLSGVEDWHSELTVFARARSLFFSLSVSLSLSLSLFRASAFSLPRRSFPR